MTDYRRKYSNDAKVQNNANMQQRHEVSKCCCKNGLDRLARSMDATTIQFVKKKKKKKHKQQTTISVNCKIAKCNKTRHACISIHLCIICGCFQDTG